MIIVRLSGGLGNQLFQYAAGRRLAQINSTSLKLDLSAFKRDPVGRRYALAPFNLQAEVANPSEISWYNAPRDKIRRIKRWFHQHWFNRGWQWVVQRSLYFEPMILELSGNIYLEGNWQSEKYFKDIEVILRSELTLQQESDPANRRMAAQIQAVEAVSLHIRRGDYVTNMATYGVHGVCSLDYYAATVQWIAKRVTRPYFFIFSDDTAWAREHLSLEYPQTLVDHNGPEKDYEDLHLMSLCRHHIIANSTFSWWGAWLSMYENKLVVAPSRWLQQTQYNIHDIIPQNWHYIDGA